MDRSRVAHEHYYYHVDGFGCKDGSSLLIRPHKIWILILCIFYLSKALLLSLTMLNFCKVFLWLQQQEKQTKALYKASGIVLTFVNIVLLVLDIVFMIIDEITNDVYGSVKLASFIPARSYSYIILPAKALLVLLIVILESSVVCFNTHRLEQNNRMIKNDKRYRIAHAFAFCQIIGLCTG